MPPRREPGPLARRIGRALAVGIAICCWPLVACFGRLQSRRQEQQKAARAGESICTFARSFPRRSVDPWILRAIYAELQETWQYPIRADDRFERDLWLDVEEVEWLAVDVAARARRSLPRVADVAIETVRDLVLFLERQPRLTG